MTAQQRADHFQDSVVYQIYVRSFCDSNGDGIGDVPGIIKKLPYLETLGVRYLWLNPIYPSPQYDNGYDISDYRSIDPMFGTMDDFDRLVAEAGRRGIGIVMDMVLNHTSTEHPWFQKALAGDAHYRDFYYFVPPRSDGGAPCNWQSKFGGSAWEKVPGEELYYLHLFAREQADLNWKNPEVRNECLDILRFWKNRGVAGFRFDVVNLMSKPDVFEDDHEGDGRRLYTDGPMIETYFGMFHDVLEQCGGPKSLTVGELSSTSMEKTVRYGGAETGQLSMVFHFHHLKSDYVDPNNKWIPGKLNFPLLRDILHSWQGAMYNHNAWDALFWNNHDQPRALTRFASDKPEFHYQSATMLAAVIHFQRGIPYIYQGEEIGMFNPGFNDIGQYRDVETLNFYKLLCDQGKSHDEVMAVIKDRSRDNSRTPMQWDDSKHAGFTTGVPWIETAKNKTRVNVRDELARKDGVLAFYRRLIELRRKEDVIQNGSYQPVLTDVDDVFAYVRETALRILLCLNNFSETTKTIPFEWVAPCIGPNAKVLAGNYPVTFDGNGIKEIVLRPYETLAIISDRE